MCLWLAGKTVEFCARGPCMERRSGGNESEDDGSGMVETELLMTCNVLSESSSEFCE